MKNVVLTLALFAFANFFGQNNNTSYIEVTGVVHCETKIETYRAEVILSLDFLYEASTYSGFEDLKSTYLAKLNKNNINTNNLKEDILMYYSTGYQTKGILMIYETKSKEDYLHFLSISVPGIQFSTKNVTYSFINNSDELTSLAISEAKKKAEKIAKLTDKKIGDVIAISDISTINTSSIKTETLDYYLYYGKTSTFQATVRYETIKQ